MGRRIVGYARVDSDRDRVEVEELVAIDDSARHAILDAIERKSKAKWMVCSALCDRRLSSLYESRGFRIYEPGWGRVMGACVDGSLSNEEMAKLYGVGDGRFIIYASDTF